MDTKFRIVCATRKSIEDFISKCALGRSLAVHPWPSVEVLLFPYNALGLPIVYNQAVRESYDDPAILIFAHDDVYMLDFFWKEQVMEGLAAFDIIGLAGTKQRELRQPSWCVLDDRLTPVDPANLSGVVSH